MPGDIFGGRIWGTPSGSTPGTLPCPPHGRGHPRREGLSASQGQERQGRGARAQSSAPPGPSARPRVSLFWKFLSSF